MIGLVIFDCDGVLIDSEALCDRVVSRQLLREGWALSPAECHKRFLGLTIADIRAAAENHLGRCLDAGWIDRMVEAVTATMAAEVELIPGAREALQATTALGLPFRIGSNSSRKEMQAKFRRTGLDALIPEERIHSAYDLMARGKRGKPDPDLFLEAAAAEGVSPASCVVIEDSLAGIRAAVAAGMTCLAYAPEAGAPNGGAPDYAVPAFTTSPLGAPGSSVPGSSVPESGAPGSGPQPADLRRAGALPFQSMFALGDRLRSLLHEPS